MKRNPTQRLAPLHRIGRDALIKLTARNRNAEWMTTSVPTPGYLMVALDTSALISLAITAALVTMFVVMALLIAGVPA